MINSINKLEKIIDWLGNEITYVWDPVGNLSEIIYPNGITAAMSYDSSNRLISVEHTDNYEATICSHQYTLDDVGNRTALSMNQPLVPTPLVTAHTYSYEFMNKLTSVDGTTTFTYDNHGNTISKVSSDITSTYSYDDADRLIQRQIDEDITQYCYNGLGHRISKQVGTQTTRYILDINSPLSWVMAETDESNQITAYYVYGSEVGLVSKITPAGQAYYYHYDGAGNTICMTDSSGTIVNKYAYDEFGILTDYVETIPNPFRYVGRYGVMDEGNGLLFMRARYYDPEIGRFLSTDPVGFAGGDLNLYSYVRNNPVNLVDPSGLIMKPWGWGLINPSAPDIKGWWHPENVLDDAWAAEKRNFPNIIDPYGGAYRHCVASCLLKKRYGIFGQLIRKIYDHVFENPCDKDHHNDIGGEQKGELVAAGGEFCEPGCRKYYP